nr:reverse transcriptase domain-containing protein [Tanacetum cinerariifolium]
MLRAFLMSLTGAASRWLKNKPTGSITTWDGLKTKFLNKYCPPARTTKKMEEINNFQQEPDENLYQAWEQFKELLMKCPQHYLTEMHETAADAKVAIQEMAEYSQKWQKEHLGQESDANNAKDLITPKIYSKKKGKPSRKLTTLNLVDLFKEEDIEQQLRNSIKGTTQILRPKNEGNL